MSRIVLRGGARDGEEREMLLLPNYLHITVEEEGEEATEHAQPTRRPWHIDTYELIGYSMLSSAHIYEYRSTSEF